jgi:nitrite reductase (NADH) large subunit
MEVTVVHLQDCLMERQLDRAAAHLLQRSLEKRGLRFKMSTTASAILGAARTPQESHTPQESRMPQESRAPRGPGVPGEPPAPGVSRVTSVLTTDGALLPADLVVMAVGITPHTDLAQSAGLRCERGILVDDTMLTYDPSIYAVGECVQHRNSTYGLVAPLWEQARVCAGHLAEIGLARYRGSLLSTQLKVTGVNVFSAGNFSDTARGESLVFKDTKRGVYKRLIIEDDRLRGAVLYGDTTDGPWYVDLMTQGRRIGPLRDQLMFGGAFAANS